MTILSAFFSGLLFGMGMIIAGMANPAKVLAFLDLAGKWDPSLALVMGAAIPVSAVAFFIAEKRKSSLTGQKISLPDTRLVNWRLIVGSLLFGTGWGLAGICPGPAIALPGYGSVKGLVFVASLVTGMLLFSFVWQRIVKPA
jgi:uncharacterized membrane protein YedE/YeeE